VSASGRNGGSLSDDSHWGSSSLKGGLLAVLGTAAVTASLIGLFAWSPWGKPTEIEWLSRYESALEAERESAKEQTSAALAGDVEAFVATLDDAGTAQEVVKDAADELGGVESCAF